MNVLLGVTGGIAAYKACELVSLSVKAGHSVRVITTSNARRFVGEASFEALSGHAVMTDTFADPLAHIEWAKWADVACVAPASANFLGKLACGLADDALSTTLLALPRGKRLVVAPAMNTEMWFSAVVQRNLRWIAELGHVSIVPPVDKRLACGDVGPGGLAEPADILAVIEANGRHAPSSG
jgi:phosphopantothenoylcysteine decarboxylase/phosphopantothenate--cysteine ligase